MCIVGRSWDRYAAGAPNIGVAQLVGQGLKLVCVESVVVPQDMVVGRTTGALQSDIL